VGKAWPPLWRWSHRKAIAEERVWRAAHSRNKGWGEPEPSPGGVSAVPEAADVAAVYRALRKGREDNKDESGGADFYYGEMEMRWHDDSEPLAERVIIWLYWLVSGYGLRASRALTALVVTILVFGVLFYQWGFPSQVNLGESLTFSAQSTTSLFRAPERQLTLVGDWFEIALRLLGPLFFGLALLSLRGRVRR
jgi:hypothetical protein